MRKKKNLNLRLHNCSLVHIEKPELYKGRWLELNSGYRELYLELGCGKGRFTVETAEKHPNILFVAVEKVRDALIIAMERAKEKGLKNVYFISDDVMLLPEYFAENEVSRIYINFCDPWPTNRQAKRRLTSPRFLGAYKMILKNGGEIHFKTDNQPLYEYSLEQFSDNGFSLAEVNRNLHSGGICGVMTDYEAKFHEQGLAICRCEAVLGGIGE